MINDSRSACDPQVNLILNDECYVRKHVLPDANYDT
jgi:hypothetical protein